MFLSHARPRERERKRGCAKKVSGRFLRLNYDCTVENGRLYYNQSWRPREKLKLRWAAWKKYCGMSRTKKERGRKEGRKEEGRREAGWMDGWREGRKDEGRRQGVNFEL